MKLLFRSVGCIAASATLVGCSALISSATSGFTAALSDAVMTSDDPQLVEDGLPSFFLMLEALIQSSPRDAKLLATGSYLYGSYSTAFIDDPERQKVFGMRAKNYAFRSTCIVREQLCNLEDVPYDDVVTLVEQLTLRDIAVIFTLASGWSSWIQSHTDDWFAIAQLAKVRLLMEKVLELEESHEDGSGHMYLGVLETLLPAALGGRPEIGRDHFERAIELSDGRNLYAKVLFAESYARLVFNRELHDELLEEVVAADPVADRLTLQNRLAQQQAKDLLASADEYF